MSDTRLQFHPITLAERRLLPDWLIRIGIRRLLTKRLRKLDGDGQEVARKFAEFLRQQPIAVHTSAANSQHYEVPPAFFEQSLGPRLKYSCCHFDAPNDALPAAEESMLRLTCERAAIADGQRILDLGCGWGSFSLYVAEHFPQAKVVGVSNSKPQREFILQQARVRQLENLEIITADMREFEPPGSFDRVVSIEMFEHMRNYEQLLRTIAGCLRQTGKLFVHIFCHQTHPYEFAVDGDNDWMARHFFTGGIMPSYDLFAEFQEDFVLREQWKVNGRHYARTCEAWLSRLDAQLSSIRSLFAKELDATRVELQIQRWRIFYMACAELFAYNRGEEWFVGHYLWEKMPANGNADSEDETKKLNTN
jgi:cyclopropane-fatty-acyl-phospholipid synthase